MHRQLEHPLSFGRRTHAIESPCVLQLVFPPDYGDSFCYFSAIVFGQGLGNRGRRNQGAVQIKSKCYFIHI